MVRLRARRTRALFVLAAIVGSLAAFAGLRTAALAQEADGAVRSVALDRAFEHVAFAGRGRIVVWSEARADIRLVDSATHEVRSVDLAAAGEAVTGVLDVAPLAPDGRFVALAARASGKAGPLVIAVSAEDEVEWSLPFDETFLTPKIAAGTRRDGDAVFLLERDSSVLTVVPGPQGYDGTSVRRSDFARHNVFLTEGPAREMVAEPSGRYVMLFHPARGALSVADTERGELLSAVEVGGGAGGVSLLLSAIPPTELLGFEGRFGLLAVEPRRAHLFVLTFDPTFERLTPVLSQPLVRTGGDGEPLFAAADDLSSIVLGARGTDGIAVLSLRENVLAGSFRADDLVAPAALDVAPDGSTLAVLSADGTRLELVDNPVAWARAADPAPRDDEVMAAQATLAAAGFYTGLVDGLPGPRTEAAIGEFQSAEGLAPTRRLDEATASALEAFARELGGEEACRSVPEEQRCGEDAVRLETREGNLTHVCSTNEPGGRPLQFDSFTPAAQKGAGPSYDCSLRHSCAYVRARVPILFDRFCPPG